MEKQDPEEQLPPAPTEGAPDCGPPSGGRLILAFTHEEVCWIKTLIDYIEKGDLPEDEAEAECVSRQAKMYCVVNDNLFRRRPNGVDRKSTRLNSSHITRSRMPSSA